MNPSDTSPAASGEPAFIEVRGLLKSFAGNAVLKNVDLVVPKGKVVTLLGPSGCGKTTTLRCIAGLETPDGGTIRIAGKVVDDDTTHLAPRARGLGIVFQSFALWPHLRVRENIAFPLRRQRVPQQEIIRRTDAVLALVGLGGLGERYPGELSGGQQQRVALARAVVGEPGAILYDEPLSNLDAQLREEMRGEIRALHDRLGITAVYVTHDQEEAIDLSDEIYVMRDGVVVQQGAPVELFDHPRNTFVCGFFGQANVLPVGAVLLSTASRVELRTPGGLVLLCRPPATAGVTPGHVAIRPHCIKIEGRGTSPLADPADRNRLPGSIVSVRHFGVRSRYRLRLGDGSELDVDKQRPGETFNAGDAVIATFAAADCVCLED